VLREIKKFRKRPRFKLGYDFLYVFIALFVGFAVFLLFTFPRPLVRQVKTGRLTEFVEEATTSASMSAHLASPAPSVAPSATQSAAPIYSGYCLNVPVIFYHHIELIDQAKTEGHAQLTVDSNVFDSQMAYLVSRGYNPISVQELADGLISKSGVPGHSIAITMDDGYVDFFTYAYPILQKYHLKASLAIPTGLIGNGGDYMNWDQLKQAVGSGLISAYNHTWSHTNLAGATAEKDQYEVSTAKQQLHDNVGVNSNVFFYPYGGVNNTAISMLTANGYNVAFSTLPGSVQCDSFLMSLHRTRIGNAPLSSYGL
jgi:peptidoglycan/xylan/chitin deacetylase (PgdA/CDA1 family)